MGAPNPGRPPDINSRLMNEFYWGGNGFRCCKYCHDAFMDNDAALAHHCPQSTVIAGEFTVVDESQKLLEVDTHEH